MTIRIYLVIDKVEIAVSILCVNCLLSNLLLANNKARISYGRVRLVFQGFHAYPWRTFTYTDMSQLGSYDVIMS